MASKNVQIAKKGADALFVFLAFSEVDSPGPEDGVFRACPPETTCNYDGGANQLDWDPGDLAMTYVPGLAQVPGTNPATGAYGYFATDHLGSTRGVYNQSKAMTAALEYAPYGEPRAWRGDAPAPTYTGHYRDAESGLYFAPYRYYLPDAGRWLTRDPLGMVDGPNVYGYVGGRPVHLRDVMGLSKCDDDDKDCCGVAGRHKRCCEDYGTSGWKFRACKKAKDIVCSGHILACQACCMADRDHSVACCGKIADPSERAGCIAEAGAAYGLCMSRCVPGV